MTAKQALDLKTTTKPMLTVLGTTLLFSGSMADQFVHFTERFIPAFVTLSVLGKSGRDEDLNFFYSQPQFGSVRCRGWNPTWDTWFPEARTEQLLLSLWPASRFICVSLILCICASVHLLCPNVDGSVPEKPCHIVRRTSGALAGAPVTDQARGHRGGCVGLGRYLAPPRSRTSGAWSVSRTS